MTEPVRSAARRRRPSPDAPEVRVVVTSRSRLQGRLDYHLADPPDEPPLAAIVETVRPLGQASGWWLAGGEPTLRADFPQLVRALASLDGPPVGMITDGLALAAKGVPGMLAKLGLARVRIQLASARADAHDWTAGRAGVWRRAVKAVRASIEAGLAVEVACPVTRPTRPYVEEAVEFFARLGVNAAVLRRVTGRGGAAAQDVTVLARLGLLQKDVERAVTTGQRLGLTVWLEGFPRCAVPGAAAAVVAGESVRWVGVDPAHVAPFAPPASERGCFGCPGAPSCDAAPKDYVDRFGRMEIDSESTRVVHPGKLEPTALEGGEVYPPPRAGRYPPSKVAYARLAAQLPSLSGDPLIAVQAEPIPDRLRFVFLAASRIRDPILGDHPGPAEPETTRNARVRLVKAAQLGASRIRIASAGSLAHPGALDLIRECARLQFPRIEVAGEGSALMEAGDRALRRLRGMHRLDVALFGPEPGDHDPLVRDGAFDAALDALDRIGTLVPSIELGCYAVLRSEEHLLAFAEAWDRGDLPGQPQFRLAPGGGDLVVLARTAEQLPAGPARRAIAAVLPVELFPRDGDVLPAEQALTAWGDVPESFALPSGADRVGCYTARPSGAREPGACPGYAVGWSHRR